MNEKMKTILAKMANLRVLANGYMEDGANKDVQKAADTLEEIKELQKEYEVEKALYESSQPDDNTIVKAATSEKKTDGFELVAKYFGNKALTEDEQEAVQKALVTNGEGGENYLIPEDVDCEIKELRKQYASAKDIVTVIPTESTSGSFNFESGTPDGLTNFNDGENITAGNIAFVRKSFKIKLFGKIIPVSNILAMANKANLLAYINRWFIKNAILTENKAIFAALASGKTATKVNDYAALKKLTLKTLDPAVWSSGVYVTNQSGYAELEGAVDGMGRPVLTPDARDSGSFRLNGMPIKVYSDAELPNIIITGKTCAPVFFGDTKSGAYFMEFGKGAMLAASEHALFGSNQTALRVVEGFDVLQADTTTYGYAGLEIAAG